jgi:hypothetical protein
MLMWHRRLWLIDHGASLYFHHSPGWEREQARARVPFAMIKDHVLLRNADAIAAVDAEMAAAITAEAVDRIVGLLPAAWLQADGHGAGPEDTRAAYRHYLEERLRAPRAFVEEAIRGR